MVGRDSLYIDFSAESTLSLLVVQITQPETILVDHFYFVSSDTRAIEVVFSFKLQKHERMKMVNMMN